MHKKIPEHYYGDSVRQLFFSAAAIMAALLPFVHGRLEIPLGVSIGGILALIIAAGLTKPKRSYTAVLNGGLSLLSAGLFEYYAVGSYQLFTTGKGSIFLLLFLANQVLTIIFIFALYLSVKTIRGLLDKNEEEES